MVLPAVLQYMKTELNARVGWLIKWLYQADLHWCPEWGSETGIVDGILFGWLAIASFAVSIRPAPFFFVSAVFIIFYIGVYLTSYLGIASSRFPGVIPCLLEAFHQVGFRHGASYHLKFWCISYTSFSSALYRLNQMHKLQATMV